MTPSSTRRRLVAFLGASALTPLAATPALAEELRPTPRMSEGPFYPRDFPRDADGDLTRIAGRAGRAKGTPLRLTGRVLDRSGAPRAGARVEIWQCDALGHYHHVDEPGPRDEDFQGYGAVAADAEGRYAFVTIRPVAYPGRTPHIHFNVLEDGRRRLTSQMFVEGEAGNARDGLYRRLGAEARLVTLRLAGRDDALSGSLDIVLA